MEERLDAALGEASETDRVVIEKGALGQVGEVFEGCFGAVPAVIVADERTFEVAREEVERSLKAAGCTLVGRFVFPVHPPLFPDSESVGDLREWLRGREAVPVAVGAGTINDITKRASHECGRPYMAVATAASVDGYTSFGATITEDGYKHTLPCPAPRAVVADVEVLAGAPERMTASGYADLLGKITSGADWIVADALGVEAIDRTSFEMVQGPLRRWTASPGRLRRGDEEAVAGLMEGLVMSGLAMQRYRSSRTASGAEHQFSHLWEMEGLGHDEDPPLSHGFKVGVGTVAIAALYERMLLKDLTDIDVDGICRRWPGRDEVERRVREAHPNPVMARAAVEEALAKHPTAGELRRRLVRLTQGWEALRGRLREQLLPPGELRRLLAEAGCPTSPREIGLGWESFRQTYARAQTIRRRYTVLDLALESGLLEECVEELFAPDGFWGGSSASP